MAINRVDYSGETLIDISQDTVESSSLLSGYTAHKKDGTKITGNVVIQKFRTGSEKPDDSVGDNGDLFLVLKG